MKPTPQRKAQRAANKKKAAAKAIKRRSAADRKRASEERRKKKQSRLKEQRKDFEKKRRIKQNNVPEAKQKVLSHGDGVLPESKKHMIGKAAKEENRKVLINTLAEAKGKATPTPQAQ